MGVRGRAVCSERLIMCSMLAQGPALIRTLVLHVLAAACVRGVNRLACLVRAGQLVSAPLSRVIHDGPAEVCQVHFV